VAGARSAPGGRRLRPLFLTGGLAPLLAAALAGQEVPRPESHLGFVPGADFRLSTYEESVAYFHALDEASDRLRMVPTGVTSEGRTWYVALISSPENLAGVERHRAIARRLADPRGLTDAEARALALEGRAIVDVSGGLHATEVAGAQHTIALAYELVSSEEARIEAIRDNVIVALWPSLNPDGQTIVTDWYRDNLGTPYEVSPLPRLYQKYIGHDNNRDAYMLNMVESRVLARTWRHWEPQIIYVHHQSSPFPTRIWLPPFAEPIASLAPPLMSRTVNTIGMTIAQMLESRGLPGAVHMGSGFDAWYPGYVDYLPMLQHQAAFWTETALYRYATPHFYTLSDFPDSRRDLRSESLYPSPWPGGWWRLGDAVEYMRVASLAVLDYAAKYREDLLYNRYQSGSQVVDRYRAGPPYAYFVPREQPDPVAPVELLRRLAYNGIEISEVTREVIHDGQTYPPGTWVIAMDQPFAELARQLLEVQTYPDLREYPEGPPEQPYDAAGWTLGYQMGVRVIEARSPLATELRGVLRPVEGEARAWDEPVADAAPFDVVEGVGFDDHPVAAGVVPAAGRIRGSGAAVHLDPAQNNSYRALNLAWDQGAQVRLSGEGGGAYIVTGLSGEAAGRMAGSLALRAEGGPATGTPVERPKVGLYRPWTASMDEGWTRWLLERHAFTFTSLTNADVHAGDLRSRYDVIVLPSERPASLRRGHPQGTVPPAYAGGLEDEGVRELDAFVSSGGTLVCLNQASVLCIEDLHLAVTNAVDGLPRDTFFSSGSLMEVVVDQAHPVMAGMPERSRIFFDRSPVFRLDEGFDGSALALYPERGTPLVSGYLLGEEHLQGLAAAVDVRHGEGRVVLIGFRPQWRGQPFGTFRVLFNSLLFHGELAERSWGTPGFGAPRRSPPEGS
jgi:hypothetical protein